MMVVSADPQVRASVLRRQPISRVAVGVNGFAAGQDAAVLATAIARPMHAEIMLVAVHPPPVVVLPDEVGWKAVEKQAVDMLAEVRECFAGGARTVVETDLSVPRALERVVRREHGDLLVVGSSRHAPEGHVRIGKRTRELLSHLRCPLAIAPRGLHVAESHTLKRIVVGYDGGPEAELALGLATRIALAADAELAVCAVVDDRVPPVGWPALAHGGASVPRSEDAVLQRERSLHKRATKAAHAGGARAQVEVRTGRPADPLLELSRAADLLVIGSRRWGPAARLLFGSTGEALAHDAACPLLVAARPAPGR